MAKLKDRSGRNFQFLAVTAVLVLIVAAGLVATLTVIATAHRLDEEAQQRQYRVLAASLADLQRLDTPSAIIAAGRRLGLHDLAWVKAGVKTPLPASMEVKASGGRSAGRFVWLPERPGARFLADARPGLATAGGLFMLCAFAALWLTRTGMQRISAERARAEQLANSDHLTGLSNRRVYKLHIANLFAALKAGRVQRFSLLAIDLDRFKALNDRLGHVAGDEALAEVARRLKSIVPAASTLARLGGDEFALLVPACGPNAALVLASRLGAAIAEPYLLADGIAAHLGASIGIACAPLHGNAEDDIVRRVDMALYEVKEAGGSAALLFEPVMEARAALRAMRGPAEPSLSTSGQRSTIAR